MPETKSRDVFDFDDNLRIVGTAHISKKSIETVLAEIKDWQPDVIAVELCESRLKALKEPEKLESETLLEIVKKGKAPMVILQLLIVLHQAFHQ